MTPEIRLLDADDKLRLLPGLTYEEFLRRLALADEPEAGAVHSIEEVRLEGTDRGAVAELTIRIQIRLLQSISTTVPLAMGGLLPKLPSKHEGEGRAVLRYEGGQLVCDLEGERDSVHTLEFQAACPLRDSRVGRSLSLRLPSAPMGLVLRVPQTSLEASTGAGANEVLSTTGDANGTTITVGGLGGELQLTWRPLSPAAAPRQRFLRSRAVSVDVRVHSPLDITSTASLEVRSVGGGIGAFEVELPPYMKIVPRAVSGARIEVARPLDPQATGDAADGGVEVVRVTLDNPDATECHVELSAALAQLPGRAPIETVGFRVRDAAHQLDRIAVVGDEGWSVRPETVQGLRRLPASSASATEEWRYGFAESPMSLKVQVQPAKTRVQIQPTYVFYVVGGQVRLDARLNCMLQGAPGTAASLGLQLAGWTVTRITPDLFDAELASLEQTDPLVIPLRRDDGASSFTLRVQAVRPLDPDAARFSLEIPRPVEGAGTTESIVSTSPARVMIAAADNIELTPRAVDMAWLTEDSTPVDPTEWGLPRLQQPLLVYDAADATDPARFEADLEIHPASMTAELQSRVTIAPRRAEVDQRLRYQISFERIRSVQLDADAALTAVGGGDSPGLRVLLGELPLPFEVTPGERGRSTLRVTLPEAQIGELELSVRYSLPLPPVEESPVAVRIPLVRPLLDEPKRIGSHQLVVRQPERTRVFVESNDWLSQASEPGRSDELLLTPVGDGSVASLVLDPTTETGASVVTHCWIQSWLVANGRSDRAVFRVEATRGPFEVLIPGGATDGLQVAVDGVRVEPRFNSQSLRVAIDLPQSDGPHVVELWYVVAQRRGWWGGMDMRPPLPALPASGARSYWQVVAPESQFVFVGASDMTPETEWRWHRLGQERYSSLQQEDLEGWIGASRQAALPEQAHSRLFSSYGLPSRLPLTIVARGRLVFALAGLALVGCLAVLRLPMLRRPELLSIMGVLVGAAAIAWPEVALGGAHAVALGLLLALAGRGLERLLLRRKTPPAPARRDESRRSWSSRVEQAPHATTVTLPAAPVAEPKL